MEFRNCWQWSVLHTWGHKNHSARGHTPAEYASNPGGRRESQNREFSSKNWEKPSTRSAELRFGTLRTADARRTAPRPWAARGGPAEGVPNSPRFLDEQTRRTGTVRRPSNNRRQAPVRSTWAC